MGLNEPFKSRLADTIAAQTTEEAVRKLALEHLSRDGNVFKFGIIPGKHGDEKLFRSPQDALITVGAGLITVGLIYAMTELPDYSHILLPATIGSAMLGLYTFFKSFAHYRSERAVNWWRDKHLK
jgi:hypothetical protein